MSWQWHAAYFRNISQTELTNLFVDLVEKETENGLVSVDENAIQTKALTLFPLFFFVSPCVNGWTTVWCNFWRLSSCVLQEYQLSGLVLWGEDDLKPEPVQKDTNSWGYQIWENGMIQNWHVYNAKHFFNLWSDGIQEVALPYLHKKGANVAQYMNRNSYSTKWVLGPSELYFKGSINDFKEFNSSDISLGDFENWLGSPCQTALGAIAEIANIPLIGPEYVYEDVLTYWEITNTGKSFYHDLHYYETDPKKRTGRSNDWKKGIEDLKILIFDFGRIPNDQLEFTHILYSHIFYY